MKYVDIFEFSRSRGSIKGEFTAENLPEALSLLEGDKRDVKVTYEARGTGILGRHALPGAELTLKATVVTACVRCGEPVELIIEKTVPFLFTKTEEEADAIPLDEDDDYEIVVGATKFDLAQWVQEEVILSLPAFAQHDDCEPDADKMHSSEDEEVNAKPNPFACLASLKTKKP